MSSHKIPESERFKGFANWVQYILARGLVSLLQILPIGLTYKMGRGAGWLSWKFMSKRRLVVRKNLEIINTWIQGQSANNGPPSDDAEEARKADSSSISSAKCNSPSGIRHYSSFPLETQIREVFQRAGANLFSGFTLSRMSPEQVEDYLQIEGLKHLDAALLQGKGVILLLAHMGPWEALNQLPVLASLHGIKVTFGAMYRPLNNTYFDNWLKTQREACGDRLFSRIDGFHKPVDFIRSGGMLGILADQKMREGPLASYFRVEVPTSPIPGLFHRRSGAPMLAMSFATVAPMRWKMTLTPVTYPAEVDLSSRAALALICNQALEQGLASSPCDGFWMHKRF
ncbi:MAG: lysophospholipid acyltransferase family protein [Verrucomicrobiota bacterium]|nr:lysophospholipid acyltransferase family protein [Verrucomicrobiota bacterium]